MEAKTKATANKQEKQRRKRRIEKLKDRLQDIDLKLLEQQKGSVQYLKLFEIRLEILNEIKGIQNEMAEQKKNRS